MAPGPRRLGLTALAADHSACMHVISAAGLPFETYSNNKLCMHNMCCLSMAMHQIDFAARLGAVFPPAADADAAWQAAQTGCCQACLQGP